MSGDPICNPTSVDPPLQSVTWPNMVRGCAADVGGGCGGLACVAAPFGFDRLCVYQLGNQACPAGEYSEAMVVERYNAASDLRACDVPCTCTPLSPGCGGSLKTFDTAGCVGQSFTIPNLACNDAGFVPASAEYIPMATGTCTPEVRTPTGTVVSFDTTTVCCKPL